MIFFFFLILRDFRAGKPKYRKRWFVYESSKCFNGRNTPDETIYTSRNPNKHYQVNVVGHGVSSPTPIFSL